MSSSKSVLWLLFAFPSSSPPGLQKSSFPSVSPSFSPDFTCCAGCIWKLSRPDPMRGDDADGDDDCCGGDCGVGGCGAGCCGGSSLVLIL